MSDTYGVPIPIPVPASGFEISDAAVTYLAQFVQAILNVYAVPAWQSVAPTITGLATPPGGALLSQVVKTAFGHNPTEEVFNEAALPAVYVWRHKGERPYWLAEDYRVDDDTWTLQWIFRPAQQKARQLRQSFIFGLKQIIDERLENQRDPSYVAAADPDPTAATTAAVADAIKTSIASSTSAQSYSGAALNGPTGATAFAPAQLPTVTVTGVAGSGTVELTGIGADGLPRVSRVALSGTGTFTGDFQLGQLTQIDVPAQSGTAATLTFGLAGFAGLGTNVLLIANLMKIEVASWTERTVVIRMGDTSPPREYDAIEIAFNVVERLVRDLSAYATSSAATQYPVTGGDNAFLRGSSLFS